MTKRSTERRRRIDRNRFRGLEICEITPVIVGGDPLADENKIALTREQHIEYVRHWNALIRELRIRA